MSDTPAAVPTGTGPAPSPAKPPKKHVSLLRHGSILSLLTLGSRILGLAREMVKAAYLGTTPLSDAFTVAFMLPNLLRRLFAEGSVAVALIPTFREYRETKSADETRRFLSATFTVLIFLVTLAAVLGMLAAPYIVRIFGTVQDETTLLTRLMFPYLIVISVAAFLQGILNGADVFAPSGFTPILFNSIAILCTVAFAHAFGNPARAMAFGVVLGGTVQMLFQLPYVLKEGIRFSLTGLRRAFADPGTRSVLRLIGPTIIGMAAYQINDLVSTALAGNAGTGVASSLQYSLRLQELMLGIFAVSIGTVILPELSGRAARGEWKLFNERLAGALKIVVLLTLPVTAFSWAEGTHIVSLLFKTGSFSDESVRLTLGAFRWHIAGLLFIAANRIIAPAFYARKDSATPTWAGIASFGVNISCALLLVGPFSGPGIAAALSLSSAVNTVLLFHFLGRKEHSDAVLLVKGVVLYALRTAAVAAVAALPFFLFGETVFSHLARSGRFLAHGVPVVIGGGLYLSLFALLLLLVKDEQLTALAGIVRRKLGRG